MSKMAAAAPQSDSASHASEAFSGQEYDQDGEDNDENRNEANTVGYNSLRDKKIGHRRVDKSGIVSYKKVQATDIHQGFEFISSLLRIMDKFGFGMDKHVWFQIHDIRLYYERDCNDTGPDLEDRDVWLQEWLKRVKPTSELMAAIQLGIGQSVGGLSSKPERDVLMQDFGVVEVVFFPGEGSNLTPAHHYSDFRFKTYAPVAFRYFRDLFGIQPDDFMLSLCDEPLKELSNPGASGSIFYLTQDDEFIIKTVQHKEAEFLQKLLPGYFLNISQNKRTLLPKFYGLYCYQCSGKNIRFTVMNNLLPSTVKLHEKYDMKGSTYKRKASKHERSKSSPTLKDLDFMDNHPEGLQLEKDTYDALIKTLQRDCRVLESFKIMDYSLLVGIYNLDLANKEKKDLQAYEAEMNCKSFVNKHFVQQQQQQLMQQQVNEQYDNITSSQSRSDRTDSRSKDQSTRNSLHRGKSFKTRIGQYSTPMESIQGVTDLSEEIDEDLDVPPGGIPARNAKGERLLIYLGIIDILQSFRLKKRLEHTMKSIVIDGDTISVHRPSYYAQRFLQYHATRVFKKTPTALKHSPSKKKSLVNKSKGQQTFPDQPEGAVVPVKIERSGRTISFSDEQAISAGTGAVGGKPDLLPENSHMPSGQATRSPSPRVQGNNINGNSRQKKTWIRSEAFTTLTTYPSEDALSAGTASTASLRGLGSGYGQRGASPPPSLSESTPTHTDFTEGTPSFTNSSPSCSSDVMGRTTFPNPAATMPPFTATTTMTARHLSAGLPGSAPERATTSAAARNAATNATRMCSTLDMGSTNPLETVDLDSPARSPDLKVYGKRQMRAVSPSRSPLLGYTDTVIVANVQDSKYGHSVVTSQEMKVQYSTTSTSLTSGGDTSDSTSSATTVTAMTVTEVSADVSETTHL